MNRREQDGGEEVIMPNKFLDQILTDKPLEFSFDPDTGLVTVVAHAGFCSPDSPKPTIYMPIRIMLTPESALALLTDLPKLEAVLGRAKEGITKPHFVQ